MRLDCYEFEIKSARSENRIESVRANGLIHTDSVGESGTRPDLVNKAAELVMIQYNDNLKNPSWKRFQPFKPQYPHWLP